MNGHVQIDRRGGGGVSKNRSLGQTQSFCVSELILNENYVCTVKRSEIASG